MPPFPLPSGARPRATIAAVVLALAAPAAVGLAASPATAAASTARAVPGAQLWVSRYNGPANGPDTASAMAVSPDGNTVFVTGTSAGTTSGNDYATVAYNTATGAQLWVSRYNGPGNSADSAAALAVSPDGSTVFVTGTSDGTTSGEDYATVAYDAATGAQLWVSRYNGPGNGADNAAALAVSPDGSTVFVTGHSQGTAATGVDYATVAYRASTGAQLWVRRYNGSFNGYDAADSVAVSPGGATVFVTGESQDSSSTCSVATVAYNAATGAQQWVRRYSPSGSACTIPSGVKVSPDGTTVFVAAYYAASQGYAVVAYNAASGAQRWAHLSSAGTTRAMAVSPAGNAVFVTGYVETNPAVGDEYDTVAYNAATGAKLWTKRFGGPAPSGTDVAFAVAVSPDANTVYVTGESDGGPSSYDYLTIAYNAATGAQQWTQRYNGPGNQVDVALAVAPSPDGRTVFVTGHSTGATSGYDYATIAYSA